MMIDVCLYEIEYWHRFSTDREMMLNGNMFRILIFFFIWRNMWTVIIILFFVLPIHVFLLNSIENGTICSVKSVYDDEFLIEGSQ